MTDTSLQEIFFKMGFWSLFTQTGLEIILPISPSQVAMIIGVSYCMQWWKVLYQEV
jgi:hypothetical protein